MAMKFKQISYDIHIAEGVVVDTTDIDGLPCKRVRHYRIDGRGEGFRADVIRPPVMYWEAIDGGTPVNTLDEAKALCRVHATTTTTTHS